MYRFTDTGRSSRQKGGIKEEEAQQPRTSNNHNKSHLNDAVVAVQELHNTDAYRETRCL